MPAGRLVKSSKPTVVTIKKKPTKLQRIARDVAVLKKKSKRVEYKYNVTDVITGQIITSTPYIFLLNNPNTNLQQGSGENQFIGAQYTVSSIQINARIEMLGRDNVRLAIVRFKSANEVTPTYSGGTDGVYENSDPLSFRELHNRNDFVILKEWTYYGSGIANESTENHLKMIKFYKKINLTTLVNTNGDPLTIEENAYYLMALGLNAAGATNSVLSFQCRIRFNDD